MNSRIAFVSPMPPLQSGVADHCSDLLDVLSGQVQLTVFAINDDADDKRTFPVVPLAGVSPAQLYAEHDCVVVQMANDPRMAPCLPYIRRDRCVLVLHDLNLACLFGGVYLSEGRVLRFFWELAKHESLSGARRAGWHFLRTRRCPTMVDYAMVNGLARRAGVTLVHSEAARQRLSRVARRVVYVPLVAPTRCVITESREKLRVELGISPDAFVLASFGSVQERKRVHVVMEVVAELARETPNVLYCIVGAYDQSWPKRAESLGMSHLVRFVERPDIGRFNDYIAASDLCINLRNPWMGEQSGPLLRVMSAGVPVVVSDTGAFAELPDGACYKVPTEPSLEKPELRAVIESILRDKESSLIVGQRAKDLIASEHTAEKGAQGYMTAIEIACGKKGSSPWQR